MACVIVVNYYHIAPNILYGCVSHRKVLSIGEHAHLESSSGECDMQEAKKGLHSLDYHFGYLHPSHHFHFEGWLSYAIKQRRSNGEKRAKSSYNNWGKLSFEVVTKGGGIALNSLGNVGSSFGDQ
jgi:hypothetical protein